MGWCGSLRWGFSPFAPTGRRGDGPPNEEPNPGAKRQPAAGGPPEFGGALALVIVKNWDATVPVAVLVDSYCR